MVRNDSFIEVHSDYKYEAEPYYKLQDDNVGEYSLEPSLDSLLRQLECSIDQIKKLSNERNIIFDRCPVDFVAYAMCITAQDSIDINDTEISERFPEVKVALNNLDLILFLPITKENFIEYTEDNPTYRKAADKCFKKIYRDDICDIFPRYNHPQIIEITGDRLARVKKIENCLND